MGTQGDPVAVLWSCRRAFARSRTSPAAVCGPPRLHFDGRWRGGGEKRLGPTLLGVPSEKCSGVYLCLRRLRARCENPSVPDSARRPPWGWPLCASVLKMRSEECSHPRECPGEALRPPPGGTAARCHGNASGTGYAHRRRVKTYSFCSECLQPGVRSVQLWDEDNE